MFRAICNLRNFEIAMRKLKIAKLQTNFEIAQRSLRNFQIALPSLRDFEIVLRTLEIAKLRNAILKVDMYNNVKQTCTFP